MEEFRAEQPTSPHPLIIEPQGHHIATCIFLHGFGSTSSQWKVLSTHLPHIKFVFPQAPMITFTRSGTQGAGWFDNLKPSEDRVQDGDEDEEGIGRSTAIIDALVEEEFKYGVPVIMGGFSQGGQMALVYALTSPKPLAGLVVGSARVPMKWKLDRIMTERARTFPKFWGHGIRDPIVPFTESQSDAAFLRGIGVKGLEYHGYKEMKHGYCRQEIMDMKNWFSAHFPSPSDRSPKL